MTWNYFFSRVAIEILDSSGRIFFQCMLMDWGKKNEKEIEIKNPRNFTRNPSIMKITNKMYNQDKKLLDQMFKKIGFTF